MFVKCSWHFIEEYQENFDDLMDKDFAVTNNGTEVNDTAVINKSQNSIKNLPSDSSVFIAFFIPLQLKCCETVIWSNETPNWVFFVELLNLNLLYYTKLLKKMETYCFDFENFSFQFSFDINITLIDGKLRNTCNIFLVRLKFTNNLKYVKKLTCPKKYYLFGLSTVTYFLI